MANYNHILVIMNPVSGQQDPDDVRNMIESRAARAGVKVSVRLTEGAGDAVGWAQAAADEGFDAVLVSGGDGTVVEAMTGVIRSGNRIPVGILPSGTASQIALGLRVPRDMSQALELLFDAPSKDVLLDVGYLPREDRYFALITGAGLDAQIIEQSPRPLKRRLGFLAYVLVGFGQLFRLRRRRMRLELDGKVYRLHAHTAMVVNIGSMDNANIQIGPNIWHHDGILNVVVIGAVGLRDNLKLAYKVFTKNYTNDADLRYFTAKKVKITTEPAISTQIDGDELGKTPLEVEVVPRAVRVIVPQAYDPEKPPLEPFGKPENS